MDQRGRRDMALSLAQRGFQVFRLGVRDWRPAFKGWQDEATTDETTIRLWWLEADWNIGVACGNDLLVVDVDDKPGKNGSTSLQEIGLDLGDYDTFTVRTPSGGLHLYYAAGDYLNSAGRLGRDLDIRSRGGYVVGPGSVLDDGAKNAQGGEYAIESDGPPLRAPDVILGRLHRHSDIRVSEPLVGNLDTDAAIGRAESYLKNDAPIAIQGRGGDHTTFTVAARLRDFGVSRHQSYALMEALWNDKCSPPWAADDLAVKIDNAYEYATRPAGVDSPMLAIDNVHVLRPAPERRASKWNWFRQGDDYSGSVSWLYRGILPTTGVCVLSAPSGAGKTFLIADLCHSLATKRPWFGQEPRLAGASILLVGEAYGSVKMRLAGLAAAFSETERPLPISAAYVGALAATGAWKELCEEVAAEARQIEAEHGVPVRMIVLDTLSASGILDDENNNAMAATVMKLFGELSVNLNALFVVAHHPAKNSDSERGAGAIRNNADYVLKIHREGNRPIRELEIDKSRDGETKVLGHFTLLPVDLGLDRDGEPMNTMVVSQAEAPPAGGKLDMMAENTNILLQCVRDAIHDRGELVEGKVRAAYPEVRKLFDERCLGQGRDSGNLRRKYLACEKRATDQGVLDTYSIVVGSAKIVYLNLKDFT